MTLEQAQQYFVARQHPCRREPIDPEQIRNFIDVMPQMVWSARPDGYVDYYNARWYEFTGFRCDEGGDDSWLPILHPDDRQPCRDAWYRAVRTGEPYEMEYRFHDRRTGGYRWHLGRALPSMTATGRIKRWIGTFTDIHEQKEALRALERQMRALHEADRRKNEFLATLGHELRNPLASVASAVALLRTDDARERAWATEVIARQTGQLTRLIEDLLDVCRIKNGKIFLQKEPLDLAMVLDRAVETARPAIAGHQHEIAIEYPRGELLMEGDPVRLEQIAVNLLVNAAKYTPPTGHILLQASREDQEIVLRVRDDGLGISPEKLPEIFKIFSQAERTCALAEGGLGIGLSIVQKLAELHGGSASVTSAGPGMGSEFTVRLPAGISTAISPTVPCSKIPGAEAARGKVLVVDDRIDSADGLLRLLQRRGHRVEIAHDGPAALSIATAFRPDVILLDIDLPQMDGCEVAARLRREPAHRDCLLIAISGYGQEEDHRRREDAGFDHHFSKPVDLPGLQGIISDFLSKGPDGATPAPADFPLEEGAGR